MVLENGNPTLLIAEFSTGPKPRSRSSLQWPKSPETASVSRREVAFLAQIDIIQRALIYLLTCRARYKKLLKDQGLLWQYRARCSENCKSFEDDEAGFFYLCFESVA
jgi:hypothetical protein